MHPVSYDQIEPNIAEVDSEGNKVKVTWKCPVSGAVVGNSIGYMQVDETTTMVKRGVAKTVQVDGLKIFFDFVAGLFGGNSLGYKMTRAVASPLANSAARQMGAVKFTDAMRRKATIEAFRSVEDKFRWDEDRGLYVVTG